MKTKYYYILSLALAFAMAGCSDSDTDISSTSQTSNANGNDVQFGLSLPGSDTRTVYGDEYTSETENYFPIYWVDGDLVRVASPQCSVQEAEYEVSVKTTTQDYADDLTKTGSAGIQWGSSETADFYSIYPSAGNPLNISGETVTANLTIDSSQNALYTEKTDGSGNFSCYYAEPSDMDNVIMYAVKEDATAGETVELQYIPYSTVIEFTINSATAAEGTSATTESSIYVQYITLTASTSTSTNIAGDFTFTFPSSADGTPTITASGNNSNAIQLNIVNENNAYLELSTEKRTLKAKMCLMPISSVTSLEGWTIEVGTSTGTFSLTLTSENLGSNNTALTAGLVHKITLPTLSYASKTWTYDKSNWITSLPDYKNIYLTELSLPGAWYAGAPTSDGYQATTSMSDLWNAGVRAFAVETRVASGSPEPENVIVSGTGTNNNSTYDYSSNSLGNTDDDEKKYSTNNKSVYITDLIEDIATAVGDDEFGVLVLSYADGGEGGHRCVDHGAWLSLLESKINGLGSTTLAKIYQTEVTAYTTVNDVLGKLIIKINVDENIAMTGYMEKTILWNKSTYSFSYGGNLPGLFSYNPFMSQLGSDYYSTPLYSYLSWKTWSDSTEFYRKYTKTMPDDGSFVWCFSSANRTSSSSGSDIPTYTERQDALSAMMGNSKKIYEASTHNVWFYFNAGGTETTSSDDDDTDAQAFAKEMNPQLLSLIQSKTDASPLGLVMFNQCTGTNSTYHGTDIIEAIIEMNSKFYLKHAGDE